MNTIGLAINSHEPDQRELIRCLESATGFNQISLYVQGVDDDELGYLKLTRGLTANSYLIDQNATQLNIADGMNRSIKPLTTDWIISFCDDDYFLPDNLNRVLEYIRHCQCDNFDIVHGQVETDYGGRWGFSMKGHGFESHDLKSYNIIPHGSFIRRTFFEKLGGYHNVPANDWQFWIRAQLAGARWLYIDKPIYHFTTTKNGALMKQISASGGYEAMRQLIIRSVSHL